MKKQYIFFFVVIGITAILMSIPIGQLSGPEIASNKPSFAEISLLNIIVNDHYMMKIISLTILFPLIFTFEFFFLTKKLTPRQRFLLLLQGIGIQFPLFILLIMMGFHGKAEFVLYDISFYSIVYFIFIFGLWSVLLSLPFLDRFKIINYFLKDE